MDVIIYPTETGVAVITPSLNCGLTIEQIAQKDVPGEIYEIVDHTTLPDSPQELWKWL